MSKWAIRNVGLLSKNNATYREQCSRFAAIHRMGSGEKQADVKRPITEWAENVACHLLQKQFQQDHRSIIAWEELTIYGNYRRKYKETDGHFHTNETNIILEVKASTSKNCIKSGKRQVRENLKLLHKLPGKFCGVLVLFDCSGLNSEFGFSDEEAINRLKNSEEYKIVQGISSEVDWSTSTQWIWLIDAAAVEALMAQYGPPVADECEAPLREW